MHEHQHGQEAINEPAEPITSRKPSVWLWLVLGVVSVLVFAAGAIAILVGVSAARLDRGAETPTAAALGVLGAFDRWDDDAIAKVQKYLDAASKDELTHRLIAMRAALLSRADGTFHITPSHFAEISRADGATTVAVDISVTWTISNPGNETLSFRSEDRPWTFQTVRVSGIAGSGWKVSSVESPAICDVYLKC
jgi:hypothetical protein